MGWDGIGTLIGKICTFIPGRVEQLKNEKVRILNERDEIMSRRSNDAGRARLITINKRVCEINQLLGNKASD